MSQVMSNFLIDRYANPVHWSMRIFIGEGFLNTFGNNLTWANLAFGNSFPLANILKTFNEENLSFRRLSKIQFQTE